MSITPFAKTMLFDDWIFEKSDETLYMGLSHELGHYLNTINVLTGYFDIGLSLLETIFSHILSSKIATCCSDKPFYQLFIQSSTLVALNEIIKRITPKLKQTFFYKITNYDEKKADTFSLKMARSIKDIQSAITSAKSMEAEIKQRAIKMVEQSAYNIIDKLNYSDEKIKEIKQKLRKKIITNPDKETQKGLQEEIDRLRANDPHPPTKQRIKQAQKYLRRNYPKFFTLTYLCENITRSNAYPKIKDPEIKRLIAIYNECFHAAKREIIKQEQSWCSIL